MTHDEALQLLSNRLDGPLPATQQAELDAWMAESPDHLVLAEAFQTQHGDLQITFEPRRQAAQATALAVARQLPAPVAPAQGKPARSWWRAFTFPLPAACAVAVLIGLGVLFFQRRHLEITDHTAVAASSNDPWANIGLKPRDKPAALASDLLLAGKSVDTEAGQKLRVTLPDGSLLYLNQNTSVALTSSRHLKLTKGEMFLEAIPAKSEDDRFVVETPNRTVKALGTKFAVAAGVAGTAVLVTQGKVEISDLSENLTTGQELSGDGKIVPAPRASAALDWTKDLMIAAESPLVPAGKHSGGSLVAVDPYGQEAKLSLVKFHVDVHIEDGFARTTIDQTYFNSENSRMEGTFYFPLPPDGSLSRLAMYVDGDLMEGGMADRGHARDVYETIRFQNRDPALLEWVDGSVFKMRVFPLEARQEKRIVLAYTQRLPVLYGQATYRFPAGHTLALVDQWSFNAVIKDGNRLSVNSPSHPSMKFAPQGTDMVATDLAKPAKIDRDVVLELHDHQAQAQPEAARWSTSELDGQKYLMVRYRPELSTTKRPERRDWVFLFESSGARDPLVARAQVEVIRALLTHAEHSDTFSILSVGTRVKSYKSEPQLATAENVAQAIAWLDGRHLLGALNLDQALSDATPLLNAGSNPHLVHVGGGIASIGEQRADELIKRIPEGTRYVGVGVGKRFSPAFMKVAAEKTGGLFTQVNPDEPIAWRGFEIASTLNAPRLLNVRVETPDVNTVKFLSFSNVLAHGEEFAAVANVTHAMPGSIVVKGQLDGKTVSHTLVVENVAPNADYLPRTWAKLEIDRLMAEDSSGNAKVITDLSKSMYVMTPYTSLLVLENEQMYKDFKVDRGRKDHWAMYPCPAKIPVVYIPDPNQPAGSRPDLKGQKPHENAVLQTILVRNPAKFLTMAGQNNNDQPIVTAGQFGFALPMEQDGELLTDLGEDLDGRKWMEKDLKMLSDRRSTRFASHSATKMSKDKALYFRGEVIGLPQKREAGKSDGTVDRLMRNPSRNILARGLESERLSEDFERFGTVLRDNSGSVRLFEEEKSVMNGRQNLNDFYFDLSILQEAKQENRTKLALGLVRPSRGSSQLMNNDFTQSLGRSSNVKQLRDRLEVLAAVRPIFDPSPAPDSALMGGGDGGAVEFDAVALQAGTAPAYYSRPAFTNNMRVFHDLASYAPGMSSSQADVQAVLEAEAAPRFGQRLGKIDPRARQLIDAARSPQFKSLQMNKDNVFLHDGQGRYTFERRLALGLLERVVCDGTNLWHLYPELGIGAKRTVSRFHRAQLLDLIPDFVPPAEDLARGCDVTFVDDKTVALVGLRNERVETEPEASLEIHLVFGEKGLVERRWVLKEAKLPDEVLVSEKYSANGAKLTIGKPKPATTLAKDDPKAFKPTVTLIPTPNLTPDVKSLVVLPLPLRSRDTVYAELQMNMNQDLYHAENACFEYLDADSAMKLLACEFAVNNAHNVGRIYNACFDKNNGFVDDRTGFFTLIASAGGDPRQYSPLNFRFERDPSDPLSSYLWQMHDGNIHDWQARIGFAPGKADVDTFLGKLTSFRRIHVRWQGSYTNHKLWGQRDGERQRVIDFAIKNGDNPLGWCALAMVQDRCPTQAAYLPIAKAWGEIAKKSSLRDPALYEEARCLGYAARQAEAQEKFQALFQAALKEGVLPPLDANFRSVLEGGNQNAWAELMRTTAKLCADNKARPVIVTLAWQCYQLGDSAMADTLLDQALANVPAAEKPATVVAAIYFLINTSRADRADLLIRDLLSDAKLSQSAGLWRLAVEVADGRRDSVRAIECLERALDIEYAHLPEVFDVQPIRNDYSRLLGHYEWLADASATLKVTPPKDLTVRVVKAADRWRHLDPESADVPNRVAAILRKAGGEGASELAWDYATTPLALKPSESSPWVSLAASVRQEGNWRLADKCYEMAFAAEPTNAQLLWNRAQHLQQQGQIAESRALMTKLFQSEWQPRFSGLKAQAQLAVQGR